MSMQVCYTNNDFVNISNFVVEYLKNKRYTCELDNFGKVIISFNTDDWEDTFCSCKGDVCERLADERYEDERIRYYYYEDPCEGEFSIEHLEVLITVPKYDIRNLKCFAGDGFDLEFSCKPHLEDPEYGLFDATRFILEDMEEHPTKDYRRIKINTDCVKINDKIGEFKKILDNLDVDNENDEEDIYVIDKIIKEMQDKFIENLIKAFENGDMNINWKLNCR